MALAFYDFEKLSPHISVASLTNWRWNGKKVPVPTACGLFYPTTEIFLPLKYHLTMDVRHCFLKGFRRCLGLLEDAGRGQDAKLDSLTPGIP